MKTSAQTIRLTAAAAAVGLTLAGCSAPDDAAQDSDTGGTETVDAGSAQESDASSTHDSGESDHEDMDHPADGGAPPEGIEEAANPKFDVGDTVVLSADHMPGMKGAKATIDSSTDETVYMVDLDTDEMEMTNHKWVVESEMKPTR